MALPEHCRCPAIRGAAKEFNDAKKHGPHADLFFCYTNMRSEVHPIQPAGHVSIKSAFFTLPFARLEGLFFPARNDPLRQGALGGRPWPRASGPDNPEAGPTSPTRAGPARIGESWSSLESWH